MSVRSRCLAALLALLAAAGASRAEDPPPPAPEPTAPRQPASDAIEQYNALCEAYRAERWKEVLNRVAACFHPTIDPFTRRSAVAMAATAAHRLEMWEACVQYCEAYAGLNNSVWPRTDDEDWTRSVLFMEVEALLRLDRAQEAEARLDAALARFPDLRDDEQWRVQRLVARPGNGVYFDLAPVTPSEAPALEEGRRRIERAIAPAIDHLKRRLGRSELRVPPIRILDGETDGLLAATVERRGTGWVGIVKVRVEILLQPTRIDEMLLAHEIAHVVHLSGTLQVTDSELSPPPEWLAEGLAEWLEAGDESRLRELLVGHALVQAEEDQPTLFRLLGDPAALASAGEWSQRVCGAVIFFQLERMLGREGMQRLVGRLLEESDYATVLREGTGLPLPALLGKIRDGYLEWDRVTFPGRDELVNAWRVAEGGQNRLALGLVDKFLAGAAAGPMRQYAEHLRLCILIEEADWPAAMAALKPVRALRQEQPLAAPVEYGVLLELKVLAATGDFQGTADLARAARRSVWVIDPEERVEIEKALAEAEKHLPAATAPPK